MGGLPLLVDDGEHSYIYGVGSTPLAQVDDATGAVQYLHADLLGTPRLVTDSAGSQVGTSTFDAFGSLAAHSGVQSAFGFTGNWSDPDTGLLYLRARDYDPATGQFLTVDPLVDQTRQPYAHVRNNPATRTDPTGLDYIDTETMLGWTLAIGIFSWPVALGVPRVVEELNSGDNIFVAINIAYNPVYSMMEGWNNAYIHSYNGCPIEVVAMDVLQYWGGAAGLMGITGGIKGAFPKAPGGTTSGARSVDEVLAGLSMGKQPHVRTVPDEDEVVKMFSELAHDATPTAWNNYPGSAFARADGIEVGMRPGSKSGGATIDIRYPNGDTVKVHRE